jgi:hypothetical protein
MSRPLTPGEAYLLEIVNDARDDLRHLMQRWDDRLTFQNLSFVEKYLEGRLSVVLDVEITGCRYGFEYSALANNERHVDDSVSLVVLSVYAIQLRDREKRYQQSMFIGNIELIEGAENIVPSRVRLYPIQNQIDDISASSLYASTINSTFKFLPCLIERESRVFGRDSPGPNDNLASHEVKGGSQVVDGVPNHQGNFLGNAFGHFKLEDIVSFISIFLDVKAVKVCLDKEGCKDRVKLLDVLIGPFDL